MWRGRTLIVENSRLRAGRKVLRDALTLQTVRTGLKRREVERFCRREGYSMMEPARVNLAELEEKV